MATLYELITTIDISFIKDENGDYQDWYLALFFIIVFVMISLTMRVIIDRIVDWYINGRPHR